jgi:sugar fermentation stimulation protein A
MTGGLYIVLLELQMPRTIRVGRLGRFHFDAGVYAYVGSAQRGLKARLARHARPGKPLRWHVDYLSRHTRCIATFLWRRPKEDECRLARAVASVPGVTRSVAGFGASDCRCEGHLFRLGPDADADRIGDLLGRANGVEKH